MGLRTSHQKTKKGSAKSVSGSLPPLTDDLVLLDSGLDSLAIAILVARLEETLGFDPFSETDDMAYPVTLGDFIRFYERAAESHGVDSRSAG